LASSIFDANAVRRPYAEHGRSRAHMEVQQTWDYEYPCEFCGKVWLKNNSKGTRSLCCMSGKIFSHEMQGIFPHLQRMPVFMQKLTEPDVACVFGLASNVYNNMLALGAVGVDNGKGGGWDKIHGPHAMRLSGRTYHYLPTTQSTGGLQYFTFNNEDALLAHGNSRNSERHKTIDKELLKGLFHTLQHSNVLVRECEQIGSMSTSITDSREATSDFISKTNSKTSNFDVSAFTSDTIRGERILTFSLKNSINGKSKSIKSDHRLYEPLSYPLIFCHGEDGWSGNIRKVVRMEAYLACRYLLPDLRWNACYNATDSIRHSTRDNYEQISQDENRNPFIRDANNNAIDCPANIYIGHAHENKYLTHFHPMNRMQFFTRLGQTFLCDQVYFNCKANKINVVVLIIFFLLF